jgi:hypothetical protein
MTADVSMNIRQYAFLARRKFCGCCVGFAALSVAGKFMSPEEARAARQNIVDMIRAAAATATITTYRLRGNIVVLEGSGGNIAVLTGRDGKLLVDAGITASRPRIMRALNALGNLCVA